MRLKIKVVFLAQPQLVVIVVQTFFRQADHGGSLLQALFFTIILCVV